MLKAKQLGERDIKHFVVNSETKAPLIERWNRTIQSTLYKYKMHHPKETFKKLTPYAVDNYNATANKALPFNLSPAEITPANNGYIHNVLRGDQKRLEQHTRKFIKPFRFKIGDYVRSTKEEHAFSKGYRGSFTEEVFEVRKRFRRAPQYDINLYLLKDLVGESIEGIFYEKQLQRVNLPPKIINKVLRKTKQGRLVTFLDYPRKYTEWIR